jgi:ParB family chromosome partitioning protein
MSEFKLTPLKEIHPDPNQPRKFYDESAMQELIQSVKEKGILQPILVRPNGNGFVLVCGERRYRASVAAGLTEIPTVIRHLSDDEALELQIIENLQRKDVHPMEEAVAFKSLLDNKQKVHTLEEIAARVGKSEFYVRQRMKLNALTKDWQEVFYSKKMPRQRH